MSYYQLPEIKKHKGLFHAISTRSLGSMSSRNVPPQKMLSNLRRFAETAGFNLKNTYFMKVAHGSKIRVIGRGVVKAMYNKASPYMLEGYDAALTQAREIYLLLPAADCYPLIFYDPQKHAVGLAHIGWRGAVENLPISVLKRMEEEFGTNRRDVIVGFGPGICSECNVQERPLVQEKLGAWQDYVNKIDRKHARARILEYVVDSLVDYGLPRKNIIMSGICTMENRDTFYSHEGAQQDGNPQDEGRFATVVGLI